MSDDTGVIAATRHYPKSGEPRGWVTIDRADPRVLIAAEMLERNMFDPVFVKVTRASDDTLIGAVIEFSAENGRWIYRITDHHFATDCYVAEWPD